MRKRCQRLDLENLVYVNSCFVISNQIFTNNTILFIICTINCKYVKVLEHVLPFRNGRVENISESDCFIAHFSSGVVQDSM